MLQFRSLHVSLVFHCLQGRFGSEPLDIAKHPPRWSVMFSDGKNLVAEIRHYVPILKHHPEPVTQQVAGEHPGSARTDWGRRSWVDPRCFFLVPLSSFVNLLCQL